MFITENYNKINTGIPCRDIILKTTTILKKNIDKFVEEL